MKKISISICKISKHMNLHLYIVTYNRRGYLERTLRQLLAVDSPVRACPITILDNHSSDGTTEIIQQYAENYGNVKGIIHAVNIGGNANICRAMELAAQESGYYWILGDDDLYDFSVWDQVEAAMSRCESAICMARYILPDSQRNDVGSQFVQATFITGMIIKADTLTGDVITEAYNHIHTLFPHMIPVMNLINHGKHICIVDKPVVDNGWYVEVTTTAQTHDVSYVRGAAETEVSPYTRRNQWLFGWAMVCAYLKDASLRWQTFKAGVAFQMGQKEPVSPDQVLAFCVRALKGNMGWSGMYFLGAVVGVLPERSAHALLSRIGSRTSWVWRCRLFRLKAFLKPKKRDIYKKHLMSMEWPC